MKIYRALRITVTAACGLIFLTSLGVAAWKVDPDFRPQPFSGYTLPHIEAIQPDGKIIVSAGLDRLNADGSDDASFHSDTSGPVLISPTGQLLVGYAALMFLTPNGAETGVRVAPTFSGPVAGRDIRLRVAGFQSDGSFIVYGDFIALNGVARPGLGRIRPDGTVDPTFSPARVAFEYSPAIRAALQNDGKVVILGSYNGTALNQLVRLNTDGTVDSSFNAGVALTGRAQSVAIDTQGRILRASNNELRRYDANGSNPVLLATITNTGGSTTDWYKTFTLHPQSDGTIIAAGLIDAVNGLPHRWLARLREDGTTDPDFDASFIRHLEALWTEPLVEVANSFIHVQLTDGRYYRLLLDGRLDPDFQMSAATPGPAGVTALAPAPDQKVIIAGTFTHVDDVTWPALARLHADGSLDNTFEPTVSIPSGIAAAVVQPNGKVLVGGQFTVSTNITRHGLVRFNADGSLDSGFDAVLENGARIRAIAILPNGSIVIGGSFTSVGGVPRGNLARLLPSGALDTSFIESTGVVAAGQVYHLEALPNDQLLVAGNLGIWNGITRWGAIRLNQNGSIDAQFLPPANASSPSVTTADVGVDGFVALGGSVVSGTLRPTLLLLDGTGTPRFSREILPDPTSFSDAVPTSVLRDNGGMLATIVRGNYYTVERFDDTGAPDRGLALELAFGRARNLAFDATGAVLVSGDFVGADGMAYAGALRLLPDTPPARLANISTRGFVGNDSNVLIAGFYIAGDETQRVLIRGVAQNLAAFGVTNLATDVRISVYRNGQILPIHEGFSWNGSSADAESYRVQLASDRIGAFPLQVFSLPGGGTGSTDAAALLDLPPGGYTVHLQAKSPGIGLIEAYDANGIGAVRKLINISTRGRVGVGEEKLIVGFVVDRGEKRILIRAMGPGLSAHVPGTLSDPVLELVRQSDHATIATNDNWGAAANAGEVATVSSQVAGLPLVTGSADAALLVQLPAGAYTAVISGAGDTTGIALAEVYEVP